MVLQFFSVIALAFVATTPTQIINNRSNLVADIPRNSIARPDEETVLYFQSWRANEAWSSRIMESELIASISDETEQYYQVEVRTISDSPEGASIDESSYEVNCIGGLAGSVSFSSGFEVTVREDVDFPSNAELGSYALHRMICSETAPDWAL